MPRVSKTRFVAGVVRVSNGVLALKLRRVGGYARSKFCLFARLFNRVKFSLQKHLMTSQQGFFDFLIHFFSALSMAF